MSCPAQIGGALGLRGCPQPCGHPMRQIAFGTVRAFSAIATRSWEPVRDGRDPPTPRPARPDVPGSWPSRETPPVGSQIWSTSAPMRSSQSRNASGVRKRCHRADMSTRYSITRRLPAERAWPLCERRHHHKPEATAAPSTPSARADRVRRASVRRPPPPERPGKHVSPGQNDSAWGHSVGRVGLEPTADGL